MKLTRTFTSTLTETGSTVESSGGKGHNLIKMKLAGYNVPSGLVIPTEVCNKYREAAAVDRNDIMDELMFTVMEELETHVWPDSVHKLLSVRSGAPISMPGMMDTVLNVGAGYVDDGLHPELQADCRRRFVEMYADVVMGYERKVDEPAKWLESIQKHLPDLQEIIRNCIEAVFRSWDNPRAVYYRKMNGISDEMGTAVVIQSMVFGNYNDDSGSGVLFTRNPSTGDKKIMGEFLINCQGEDVVAGTATPMALEEMAVWSPGLWHELTSIAKQLEKDAGDMQDIEFTIQDKELFILQTRNGKRSPRAEIQIALDLLEEGIITDLSERVKAGTFAKLRQPTLPESFKMDPLAKGIPAGGYFVTGKACFTSAKVLDCKEPAILVAEETTPDDIKGMERAVGIVTFKGGATSHAAVVARGMNKTCVVGAGSLPIEQGDYVLIDGQTGRVWVQKEKFDVDLSTAIPVDLLGGILEVAVTDQDWVRVDSFAEAMSLKPYVKRVGVPVAGLDVEKLKELAEVFDRVVLINPERRDRVSDFIGTARPRDMDNARKLDKAVIENDLDKVLFDSGEWVESNSARPFKTMADVMDGDFLGYITDEFVTQVMGDQETFEAVSKQMGLESRVVNMESVLALLEKRIQIG